MPQKRPTIPLERDESAWGYTDIPQTVSEPLNGSRRLSPEERTAIPMLYAMLGSKEATAEAMHCDTKTVDRWLDRLSTEEWERIYDKQRQVLVRRATEIIFKLTSRIDELVPESRMHEAVGAFKIFGERIAALGGMGAVLRSDKPTSELESLLAAGEANRLRAAIELAVATGSLECLKDLVPKEEGVPSSLLRQ